MCCGMWNAECRMSGFVEMIGWLGSGFRTYKRDVWNEPPLGAISLVPPLGAISLCSSLVITSLLPRTISLVPCTLGTIPIVLPLTIIPLVPRDLDVIPLVPRDLDVILLVPHDIGMIRIVSHDLGMIPLFTRLVPEWRRCFFFVGWLVEVLVLSFCWILVEVLGIFCWIWLQRSA